jgi:Glycosyl hydrolase family 26
MGVRHRRLPILLACIALLGCFAAAATRPAHAQAAGPIKLGAYIASSGQVSAPENAQLLDDYAAMVGRRPDIVMDYSNVTDPLLTPGEIANLEARHETPMITWQLYRQGWSGPVISLQDIAAGAYDSYLRQAADLARGLPFDVMIRFAHEMNGPWEPWGPGNDGNVGDGYVNAWRHVVSIFRQEGASNVKWVWSPNVDHGSYPFAQYFPGDAWVDYVALDGYNWGTAGIGEPGWQSLAQVFSGSYQQLTQLSSKPVIIAETSSSEIGGDKAAWIRTGFLNTIPQQFPRVSAVIWFDRIQEEDWRIDSSPASLAAYRSVVASTLYGGNVPPETTNVQSLRVTRRVQVGRRPGRHASASAASVSGSVRYRLSRSASVTITVGSRSKRKFTFTRESSAQKGTVSLAQVVGGHRLRPGRYWVVASAVDGSGAPSKPRRARFRAV